MGIVIEVSRVEVHRVDLAELIGGWNPEATTMVGVLRLGERRQSAKESYGCEPSGDSASSRTQVLKLDLAHRTRLTVKASVC
jgi:hypothetical protein